MTDYLQWQSKLSLEQVFAAGEGISYPTLFGRGVIYLTTLNEEKGRLVLVYLLDGQSHCLTPTEFNVRTSISEYGGKPFWLVGDQLLFVNQADQCIYKQILKVDGAVTEPKLISPKPKNKSLYMFSELCVINGSVIKNGVANDDWLVATAEISTPNSDENSHRLVAFRHGSQADFLLTLEEGADFYSNLVVDSERSRLAWVQWDHPSMPWDHNQLWVADFHVLGDKLSLLNKRQIDVGATASVCQLLFASNGKLFYSADHEVSDTNDAKNYWNISAYDVENDKQTTVTRLNLEFGYPHWQYGDARIAQFSDSLLITFGSSPDGDKLFLIDQDSFEVTEQTDWFEEGDSFQSLCVGGDGAGGLGNTCLVRLSKSQGSSLVVISDTAKSVLTNPAPIKEIDISYAEHIRIPTSDGECAYGYYYPPKNSNYVASQEPPPLLVMVHGGPTARAAGYFDLQKQFWTNRGFAILDVNHRGSSGYGRKFRDALYGGWGEIDTRDIIDGINALIQQGRADPSRVCIRGKSAGGYAVLRALTEYPAVFRAGACYYGIGNLVTLADTTHKFEKYYTDRLVGETYRVDTARKIQSKFYQRSPINYIDQVQSAMIIFQGLQDKVVPPELSQEVVQVLKSANIRHEYVEYPDEGHGFRQGQNNIDAWTKEYQFYQEVMSE